MVFYHASFLDMKSAAVKKLWLPIKNVSNDRDLHPDQINKLTMGFNASNQKFGNQLVAIVLFSLPHMLKWDIMNIFWYNVLFILPPLKPSDKFQVR